MRTNYISTVSFLNTPRASMNRLQSDLNKANYESTNEGRYADVGLQLGYRTGLALDLHQGLDDIDEQVKRNALTSARLDSTYQVLNQVRLDGEAFLGTVMPGKLTGDSASTVTEGATAKLTALIGQLNSQIGGQYLFGGINSSRTPIENFDSTAVTPSPKDAFLQAFQTAFGFAPGTPQSSTITAAQMQTFLADTGGFGQLFSDSQWKATWSKASDTPIQSEIARNETVDTSVSANTQSLRQLAMLYTLGSSIGLSSLSSATQDVVYDKMRSLAGSATWGITTVQADVGAVQARIKAIGEQMDIKKTILSTGVKNFEYGDWAEAGSRVKSLTAQMEVAYSLTNQVNKLNLFDYIR